MITGPLKQQIDRLWTEFWTGGIANPLTVIEQISFLMFARLLDAAESRAEKRAALTRKPFARQFAPNQQHLRWSRFKNLDGPTMLKVVRDEVFPHFRTLGGGGSTFAEYMADAQLMVQKPSLLVSAVNMVEALPLTQGDIKGDLYEYLLGKLTTAGVNGQFRTPRHIIRMMVELTEPRPDETVADPACGTAGFLVGTMQYLQEQYSSPEGVITHADGQVTYSGDLLEPYRHHIQRGMFHGFDFDATMLRIAAMNLMLHGVENPDIHYRDTLSNSFPDKFPAAANNAFDVILANPPFKGSLDADDVHPSLTAAVKTKKTELLFVALILRMLKLGGRAACVVPDGVLFGSSKAHVALRTLLLDDNELQVVVSLPGGVFKPYAGVSTAVLLFVKGGRTERVWFHKVESDGFTLDDRRETIGDGRGDLPAVVARFRDRETAGVRAPRTGQCFWVPAEEIRANKYDLSVGRYREAEYAAAEHEPPLDILRRLRELDAEVAAEMDKLEGMLK